MKKAYRDCLLALIFSTLCALAWGSDTTYSVTFNTAPLVGHPAGPFYFFVEFTPGADFGTGSDSAMLSNINLGGGSTVATPFLYGGATGSLASEVAMSDPQTLNVFSELFVPGTQLSFTLRLNSMDYTGQVPGGIAIFILDSYGVPIPTLAPVGNALLSAGLTSTGPTISSYGSDPSKSPSVGGPINIPAPVIQLVSKQVKSNVSAEIRALLPVGLHEIDEHLREAVRHVDESVSPSLWTDNYHLTERGDRVFWDEWLAVRELEEVARRYSPLSAPLRSAESTLALADRAIAETALNDVLGTGTNDYLAKAQDEISQGDLRASQGEFARAIEHYREAWILVGNPRCWDPSDEKE